MSGPGLHADDAEYVDENPLDATDEFGLLALIVIACALLGWFFLVGAFGYLEERRTVNREIDAQLAYEAAERRIAAGSPEALSGLKWDATKARMAVIYREASPLDSTEVV